MKKGVLVILLFSLLSLLQVSFLPHFPFAGWVPNLVLLSLAILAFFASLTTGIEAALAGGFFLDVSSHLPFGFWMILCLALFLGVRFILQNYVRLPQYI